MYDAIDNIIGFKDNTNTYYYIKNMQQDIIGIMDSNYNIIATYEYDSWGRMLSIKDNNGIEITDKTHIAYINPFRYRSYYYDEEIELYYLNSRYYNPTWGRFINADGIIGANEDIISQNLYAYCSNNSVSKSDIDGSFAILAALTIAGIIVGTGTAVKKMVDHHNTKGHISFADWGQYVSEGAQAAVAIQSVGYAAQGVYNTAKSFNRPKTPNPSNGYNTFNQAKKNMPKLEPGYDYHHIVEQSQIKKSGFDPKIIHNPSNIVPIEKSIHGKISGHYSSIQPISDGMRVRNWLINQDFQTQYNYGIKVIEMFKK